MGRSHGGPYDRGGRPAKDAASSGLPRLLKVGRTQDCAKERWLNGAVSGLEGAFETGYSLRDLLELRFDKAVGCWSIPSMECEATSFVNIAKSLGVVPPDMPAGAFEEKFTSLHGQPQVPGGLDSRWNDTLAYANGGGYSPGIIDAKNQAQVLLQLGSVSDWAVLTGMSGRGCTPVSVLRPTNSAPSAYLDHIERQLPKGASFYSLGISHTQVISAIKGTKVLETDALPNPGGWEDASWVVGVGNVGWYFK